MAKQVQHRESRARKLSQPACTHSFALARSIPIHELRFYCWSSVRRCYVRIRSCVCGMAGPNLAASKLRQTILYIFFFPGSSFAPRVSGRAVHAVFYGLWRGKNRNYRGVPWEGAQKRSSTEEKTWLQSGLVATILMPNEAPLKVCSAHGPTWFQPGNQPPTEDPAD